VLHVLTIAAVVTMVLLGRWQLSVSESKHFSIQNFGYSIQWWAFCAFALFLWQRIVRDAAHRRGASESADGEQAAGATTAEPGPPDHEPVAYRRYVMPSVQPAPDDDPMHAAYNDYLAQLAARDAEEKR
jgi:DNA-binding transcriptional regulator of glucitol operon